MKKIVVLAALGLMASTGVSLAGDAANGEKVFASKCKICHAAPGPSAATRPTGPNLTGVVGRKLAGDEKFDKYGDDLKKMGADGKVWDEATIATYLADPKAYNPGTKMAFAGFKDDATTAGDVAAYLASVK